MAIEKTQGKVRLIPFSLLFRAAVLIETYKKNSA